MAAIDNIPTEIVQLLSAADAAAYRLVPFRREGNTVRFYGSETKDYASVREELAVIYGWHAEIEPVAENDLQRLLLQFYRTEGAHAPKNRTADIGARQGFPYSLIGEALRDGASDIHIERYEDRCRIRLRIDGKLTERYVIEKERYATLINRIKILSDLDISEKRRPQDGRIGYRSDGAKFDVRVSVLPTIHGEKIVMRLLTRRAELLELDNLGLSDRQYEDYCNAIRRPFGMILICGPTGSGKSTTLYATLRRLNASTDNILTIEDPVEYTLEGVNQVQLKEEIGLTFGSALRTFLRQDPDIIMLGEVRDPDTAQMAVRSALTGHLLFSTIHTNTAWGAATRLADMGVHPYLTANTLVMTVAQRLVRLLCPHCKRPAKTPLPLPTGVTEYFEASGCENCYYTGYSGRRAVYEVIPVDDTLAAAIRREETDITPLLAERGITSLKDAVTDLFRRGLTSVEELMPLLNC